MVKSITIVGKRWFQKSYGNTYHTATIVVDGEPVEGVERSYGYGDHYIQSATEKLDELGIIKRKTFPNGSSEPLWQYCRRLGIKYHYEAANVDRQRDL